MLRSHVFCLCQVSALTIFYLLLFSCFKLKRVFFERRTPTASKFFSLFKNIVHKRYKMFYCQPLFSVLIIIVAVCPKRKGKVRNKNKNRQQLVDVRCPKPLLINSLYHNQPPTQTLLGESHIQFRPTRGWEECDSPRKACVGG